MERPLGSLFDPIVQELLLSGFLVLICYEQTFNTNACPSRFTLITFHTDNLGSGQFHRKRIQKVNRIYGISEFKKNMNKMQWMTESVFFTLGRNRISGQKNIWL